MVLTPGNGPDGGTIMGQAAGSQNASDPLPPPSVVLTNEHYNRIARLLEKNLPVTLEFDIGAKFTEAGGFVQPGGGDTGQQSECGFRDAGRTFRFVDGRHGRDG